MRNYDKTERNWKVWNLYRSGHFTMKQIGAQFDIAPSRVGQIANNYDRKLLSALCNPGWPIAREVRANLHTVALDIRDEKPREGKPARHWFTMTRPIRNLWTGEVIPGTDRVDPYHFAAANKDSPSPVVMSEPAGYAEPESCAEPEQSSPVDKSMTISRLPLQIRVINCLQNEGYRTLGEIIDFTEEQLNNLLRIPNFGKKSLRELREFLYSTRNTLPKVPPKALISELDLLEAKYASLLSDYREAVADLEAEKKYTAKLRSILSGFSTAMTIGELRAAGVTVDLHVRRG